MPRGVYARAPHSIRQCPQCGVPFSVEPSSQAVCCSVPCRNARQQRPMAERFWEKVNKQGPTPEQAPGLGACWVWRGAIHGGYGNFSVGQGRFQGAHRVAYELLVGPVPDTLDHLCRNPACVNPAHLEPVTNRENILRGTGFAATYAKATHCKSGHEFTLENTAYRTRPEGGRCCRTCRQQHNQRTTERRRLARSCKP